MATIFLTADTHFSHVNILKVRPQFSTVEEMNEQLVDRWNSVVKSSDTVYHLGDVAMWKPQTVEICKRLNGTKILIRGNHDTFEDYVYLRNGFAKILGMKEWSAKGGMICTHIPIHPQEMYRWRVNVHGHIHQLKVQQPVVINVLDLSDQWIIDGSEPDPRYFCVSLEQNNYYPVSLEVVRTRVGMT